MTEKERPDFDRVLRDAGSGAFDVVPVWKFDRVAHRVLTFERAVPGLTGKAIASVPSGGSPRPTTSADVGGHHTLPPVNPFGVSWEPKVTPPRPSARWSYQAPESCRYLAPTGRRSPAAHHPRRVTRPCPTPAPRGRAGRVDSDG